MLMLLHVIHIAACLASFGDSANWEPLTPVPAVDTVHIHVDRSEFATVGRREIRLITGKTPELLSQNMQDAAQFIKEYGVSGSATISKRGADATQTQVLWNGLPINHPMLGMMDFNDVSTFGVDELVVIEGGNSAMYGSGSVGGTVMLRNNLNFNSDLKIITNFNTNTLGNYQTGLRLSRGWEHAYFDFSSSWMNNSNGFSFFDPISQKNRSSFNSELESQNMRVVGALSNKQHQVKLISEIGIVERGLGFLFGSDKALGTQSDLQYRNLLQYDCNLKRSHFSQKIGVTSDRLVYTDNQGISDTSVANMLFFQSEAFHQFTSGKLFYGFDFQLQSGSSGFYEKTQIRHLPAFFTAWKGVIKKTDYLINSRYEWNERILTGGISTQTSIGSNFVIKTDLNRSFRRPTLNDLYWRVSQRNSLVPEHGWGTEIGLQWTRKLRNNQSFNIELTPFYRELNNPIIWLPQGALWSAQNLFFGRYTGIQFQSNLTLVLGHSQIEFKESLEWVNSAVKSIESANFLQQIFVPDVMSTANVNWNRKNWGAGVQWQIVGNRYTATDNSAVMPLYALISMELRYSFSTFSKSKINFIKIGTENLTNVSYQNMPGRPMPPRYFFTQLNIQL